MDFIVRSHNRKFLQGWNSRMMAPISKPLVDKVVVAILKQKGFGELPYEPRNLYDVDALYKMLEGYSPKNSPYINKDDVRVRKGLDFAFKHFAKPQNLPKIEGFSLEDEIVQLFYSLDIKRDTSAGLTDFGSTKAEAWPVGVRKAKQTILKKRRPEPCLAGVRTQAGKLGRLVWMYPLSMTIIEALVARPLITQQLERNDHPMAFGVKSTVLGTQMRKAQSFNDYFASMDSSQFDATVGQLMIRAAFNAFRTWFDLDQEIFEHVTVGDLFDIIEDYFVYTPLVMPSEKGPVLISGKRHGVPSGSYFTQMVDSFVTTAFIGTLDYTYKLGVFSDEFFVLGDDMLFFTDVKPQINKWSKLLSELYGMKINAEDSAFGLVTEPIPFLGREWLSGIPFREWEDVMERAISPERYRDYGTDLGKGAHLVLASYGATAFYRNMPQGYDPWLGLIGARFEQDHSSGLNEFLLREGYITNVMSRNLH